MNEIAYSLGSFFGSLVIGVLVWQFGAVLVQAVTGKPGLAEFIGGMLSLWYAETRDDTAGRWGAGLAIALMLLNHGAAEKKPPV